MLLTILLAKIKTLLANYGYVPILYEYLKFFSVLIHLIVSFFNSNIRHEN